MVKAFGPMEQIGIVVDNFEDPIKHWTEKLKVGPFFILEHLDLNSFQKAEWILFRNEFISKKLN